LSSTSPGDNGTLISFMRASYRSPVDTPTE
jgi:hypothetical protein